MNKLILFSFVLISNVVYAQKSIDLSVLSSLTKGDTTYLFGDNVKLRAEPYTDAEALEVLKIGSQVEIIEQTEVKMMYRGINSPWYKVKVEHQTGYILGSLLSLSKVDIHYKTLTCFINYEKINSKLHIIIRLFPDSSSTYFENTSPFLGDHSGFVLTIYDNKGLDGVDNIFFINYMPESCGANSGGYYLFFDGKKLHKVIDLFSSSDGDFWESEELYFPKDELGLKGKIILIKEEGSYGLDELSDVEGYTWEKSSKITLKLKWLDGKLKPNPKSFKFE